MGISGVRRSPTAASPGNASTWSTTSNRPSPERRKISGRPQHLLYGRRRGHKLRATRQALYDAWYRRLALPEGEDGVDPSRLFENPIDDFWFEIGFGGGEHLAWQAKEHPRVGFVGVEPFLNGVASLLRYVADGGLGNVRLLQGDARLVLRRLPEASVGRMFVLFPDPWPKTRHHRRRIVGPGTLDIFARVLKSGSELRFATDDQGYLAWTLRHVRAHPAFEWTAKRADDWRIRPSDWPETRYEQKAHLAGRVPTFLTFRRRPRADGSAP